MTIFQALSRLLGAIAALALLSGCAAITAVSDAATPLEVYELRAPVGISRTTRRAAPRDVIIELPTTGGALATDRIMIRPNRLQAQYLPDSRWSEPAPVMVQTLMLRAVEATGALRYVGREPLGVSGDYAVVTEVVDFQAELIEGSDAATVRIQIITRLVREQDARIVASQTFSAEAPAASTDTQTVVAAFNVASDQVFADFASWVQRVVAGR
ncbi:MAG: hypothetical protein HKN30_10260 [Sulfitobacter sp.]|nr:hypothetical protein [Sulfitobacter sp.]